MVPCPESASQCSIPSIRGSVLTGLNLSSRVTAPDTERVSLPYYFKHIVNSWSFPGEWRARLWNIPSGYDWVKACQESPVEINGVRYDT